MILLNIDGKPIEATPGTTVLQAARQNGIEIPTLCEHPALAPYGGCRLCLVEVQGFRTLVTSCTLPVSSGLEVRTDTPAIRSARKFVLDMLFSERNHFCMFCEKTAGDCELQNAAYAEGMTHWPLQPTWKKYEVDASHPYFVIDHNRCILCRRCVRACSDLVGNSTLSLENRGALTMLVAGLGEPIAESNCIRCGTCSQVCPTGAIMDRGSAYLAKDAQTTRTRSVCVGCSVGCGIEVVTHEGRVIRIEGDWLSPVSGGVLCGLGRYQMRPNGRERLTTPMLRKNGVLEPVSWEEAVYAAGSRLRAGEAAGIISSRMPAEVLHTFTELFAVQLESPSVSVTDENIVSPLEIGGAQEQALQKMKEADLYIVIGADLKESHPVAGFFIRRRLPQGAELILVDTKENGLSDLTWHNLRVAEGSDAALLDGLMASVVRLGAAAGELPEGFCPEHIDLAEAARAAGVSTESISSAASAIAAAKNPVVVVGKGITRPENAAALKKAASLAQMCGAPLINLSGKANSFAAKSYGLAQAFTPRSGSAVYAVMGDDYPTPRLLEKLKEAPFLAVQASYASDLTDMADVVLPVETWPEQSGHYINLESRLQKANPAVSAPENVLSSLEVLKRLAACMGFAVNEASWQDRLPVVEEW
jgi:formate dehydrogenase major subunit